MDADVARRVVFRRHGDVGVLEVEEHEPGDPAAGELLVDVAFAGVNFADVLARRGFYKWAPPPPVCVGFEIAGTVRAAGADARGFAPGDRVFAVTRFGGYASRVRVEAARAHRVPEKMSLEEAAALPAVYLTAWHAIAEVARARRGESILIQAVAGGVGTAALQLSRHMGLVTYGTASRPDKLAFARELGLEHAIDYAKDDFEVAVRELTGGRGVDIVLDSLGGEALKKGYRCLARGGRLVTIGAAQVAPVAKRPLALARAGVELLKGGLFHPFQLIEDNRSIAGVQILLYWDDVDHLARGFRELLALYDAGALRPIVSSVHPLEAAARAHEELETRASRGKVLLSMREAKRATP